jgi:dTDP-4-dehydrorhamnose reductase
LLSNSEHTILAAAKNESRIAFQVNDKYNYINFDITNAIDANKLITTHKPDVIIHAAAITQVDECELNPIACWHTNVTATRFLIDAAKKINCHFIYISTDFVFDGLHGPYKETDSAAPVNYYGSSKLAAEKAVIESALNWCIIRTVLVYGNTWLSNRTNIVSWVKENLAHQKKIKVVADQWRTPTYVEDLALGVFLAIEKNAKGIYHISGAEMMTPYDMAMATAKFLNADTNLIEKVNADTFTQPAKRPAKTGFVIDKAKVDLGYNPISFADSLPKILAK